MSKAKLFILGGVLLVFGLVACKASDQPSQEEASQSKQVSSQPARDVALPSQDLQEDQRYERRRLEQAEQKLRQMQSEIQVLEDNNADLKQQLQTMESATIDLAACRRDLADIENRFDQEYKGAVNLRAEQAKLLEESAVLRGKSETRRDLKGELAVAEQEQAIAGDELARANEQLESLQKALRELQQNYSTLQEKADKLPQLEENLSLLQAENAILQNRAQEEETLQKQLLDTRRELEEAQLKLEQIEQPPESESSMK